MMKIVQVSHHTFKLFLNNCVGIIYCEFKLIKQYKNMTTHIAGLMERDGKQKQ